LLGAFVILCCTGVTMLNGYFVCGENLAADASATGSDNYYP